MPVMRKPAWSASAASGVVTTEVASAIDGFYGDPGDKAAWVLA